MKEKLINLLKNSMFISTLLIFNIVNAEEVTVNSANNYPYKNLINRTDVIKIFYTTFDGEQSCRVEVELDEMKWISVEKAINKDVFSKDKLSNCLSRETAEQILLQTFLQFGRGL
jgi:hypothetical protein